MDTDRNLEINESSAEPVEKSGQFLFEILQLSNIVTRPLVRQMSASFQYNYAKNGKGLKIGRKEADNHIDQ